MNTTRLRTHFQPSELLAHPRGHALDSKRSRRPLWWLLIGLTLLTVFLIGLVR